MARENVKVLSVHFNKKKDEDLAILNTVGKKNFNFSGYVKRLILEDLRKKELQKKQSINQNKKIQVLPKQT